MSVRNLSITKEILKFEGADPAAYWKRFAMLLTLSVIVATMGLIRDSDPVVIAAMLIAPMMTPILGTAAALVMGWVRRLFLLLGVVLVAACLSTMLAWVVLSIADVPGGVQLPAQVLARTDPGIEDLIIALVAGVAGAYVQIQKSEISLLPGAAIGVSLVPPLASAGILFYFLDLAHAREALFLFITNLAAIIFSASVVYLISGAKSVFQSSHRRLSFTSGMFIVVFVLVLLMVQLGRSTYLRYQKQDAETRLADAILDWAGDIPVEIIRIDVRPQRRVAEVWLIVDLPAEAAYKIGSVADLLPPELSREGIRKVIFTSLGTEYKVAVRFQTRISALFVYGSDKSLAVPSIRRLSEN